MGLYREDSSTDWKFLPAGMRFGGMILPVSGGIFPLSRGFASVLFQWLGILGESRTKLGDTALNVAFHEPTTCLMAN